MTDQSELRRLPSGGRKLRLLVAYFSYTGNTRRVAEALTERLQTSCNVETVEIVPRRKRSYLHWLAYSFVPDSEVDIENPGIEVSAHDGVLLGFPKWTFSCPPLNRFIHKLRGVAVPKFFLFMTSGGFDDERFLRSFSRKLSRIGCNVVVSLTVRRRQISGEAYRALLESFVKKVEEHSQPSQKDTPQ